MRVSNNCELQGNFHNAIIRLINLKKNNKAQTLNYAIETRPTIMCYVRM